MIQNKNILSNLKLKHFSVLAFCFFILNNSSIAQSRPYQPSKHQEKYFASFFYGEGRAKWISDVSYTDLYNSDGNIIKEGTDAFKFKIKNTSKTYGLDVAAPYGPVRLGLGINFEEFYLDKILLNSTSNKAYLPFNESFRFDKLSFTVEYPLPFTHEKRYSLNLNSRLGYYGFSKVKSYNFFGGPYLGNTFFGGIGCLMDFEIVPRYYFFINVYGEYKHYRNSGRELPSVVIHRIFTGSVQAGIRINMFEYDFVKRIILGKD